MHQVKLKLSPRYNKKIILKCFLLCYFWKKKSFAATNSRVVHLQILTAQKAENVKSRTKIYHGRAKGSFFNADVRGEASRSQLDQCGRSKKHFSSKPRSSSARLNFAIVLMTESGTDYKQMTSRFKISIFYSPWFLHIPTNSHLFPAEEKTWRPREDPIKMIIIT